MKLIKLATAAGHCKQVSGMHPGLSPGSEIKASLLILFYKCDIPTDIRLLHNV